ncbi:hypothetical protein FACS1894153_2850 [Bacteroidia bacterium]|nr:hypothetical protein FACS1894153_2850 [Bacteroidia bacterium]
MIKTKKRFFLIIGGFFISLLIVLSVYLSISDRYLRVEQLQQGKFLNVAINFNSPDYQLKKGNVCGYSYHLLSEISDKYDFSVRFFDIENYDKDNIDLLCKIEENKSVWNVIVGNDSLDFLINNFFQQHEKNISALHNFYFQEDSTNQTNTTIQTHISSFDKIIKKYAKELDWDWRLLASLIYQESNFIMGTTSHNNAHGLMQMMPETMEKYGVTRESGLEYQVASGVKYLKLLKKIIEDSIPYNFFSEAKILFTIAAYNAGVNYVFKMRQLSVNKNLCPFLWFDHIERTIAERGNKTVYHNLSLSRNKALQVNDYVEDIFLRFYHYKNLRPEN